ncbi:PSD1 and planctomycete cytochrome C domain-containing protein [Tautonia plasticadhaerens]|uniref:Planctomycete cytochrome C n=1 Tax=Tautonia plasticadhaerens TaxID=2527974 RepID=A0A518GW38_9BACT|nr:PSD1 and planctomycete cytochrome C domain-containing protein [Tautonia plasticadhaerens]QDV32761.1 Planctomycete cytochrome C [Tautonia plasticadhaerens]
MSIISSATVILVGLAAPAPRAEEVDYLRDVKPVLAERCFSCHGALKQEAELRLDTAALMIKGSNAGPVVEPGDVEGSYLLAVLSGEAGLRMPPEGEPLSDEQVGHIRSWIADGAPSPEDEAPQQDPMDHWAYRSLVRPDVPAAVDPNRGENPIDAFLSREHESLGVTPVPSADRATLLRRVALDLTGLVPTREELHAFNSDEDPDAYERAVDRHLDSPHFGERWGRHWMDVWRYSDWDGYGDEVRESQPHIWRWRDWIVESLNADVGYDRMVLEMLAGDEVAPEDPETLRATGFLARNWYKFNRNIWLDNTVEHTGKAFLGLTINCARCHDHKYDPIPQDDYYRFRAIFEPHDVAVDRLPGRPDTSEAGLVRVFDAHADRPTFLFVRGDEQQPVEDSPLPPSIPGMFGPWSGIEPVALPKEASYPGLLGFIRCETRAAAERAVDEAQDGLDQARALEGADAGGEDWSPLRLAEHRVRAALAELDAVDARLDADEARYADRPDARLVDRLTIRAGLAERLASLAGAERDRVLAEKALADARAAIDRDDSTPLKGIEAAEKTLADARAAVDAAGDTLNGPLPSDYAPLTPIRPPTSTGRRLALARWITDRDNPLTARVAVNHVWMRHFGSPLVESVFDFGINGKAPTHPDLLDWLAVELMESGWSLKHLHRLIVTSRAYRMQSSAAVDHPNAAIDPENRSLWRMNTRRMESELVRDNVLRVAGSLDPALGGPDLDPVSALTSPRRSLYFRHAKEKRSTFLRLFDSANVNSCYRRDVSVAPQQALALSNSPLTLAQARILAGRLTGESGAEDDDAFLAVAFEQILGRAVEAEERDTCLDFLGAQRAQLAGPSGLTPFESGPEAVVAPSPDPRQRARENLIHVLLNHSEFLTIR